MQNENVRMKEREISLGDLIIEILLRWRVIVVAIVIGGMLFGAFSFYSSSQTAKIQRAKKQQQEQLLAEQEEQEALMSEAELLERENANKQKLEEVLTEAQIANVNSAIMYEQFRDDKKKYQEESILMQIDPFNAPRAELTFLVKTEDMEKTYNIQKIYEDLLTSTELFDYVKDECGIENAVNELISLERTSYGQMQGNDSVRIFMIHSDESICQAMADAIVKYVQQQQKLLEEKVGVHQIELIDQSIATILNTDILTQQKNCEADIATQNNSAVKLKSAFSEEEWNYYNYIVAGKASANPDKEALEESEAEDTESDESTNVIIVTTPSVSIKYVILGMILFAFGYVFVIFLMYIFNNKLRATDNLQDIYSIPQLGTIPGDEKKKKFLGIIDEWILKFRYRDKRRFAPQEAANLAAVAAKMAVKKQGVSNVCLMGCNLAGEALKACELIKERLTAEGATVQILSNVLYDAEVMEELADAQGAVLVETAGSTLYDEIAKELELVKRQNITVLGGIVVE